MDEFLTSERLLLRPFRPSDGAADFAWFRDPDVMRFMGGPDASPSATEARLTRYMAHQQRHGFAKWLVLDRTSRQPIGDAGVMLLDETAEFELGYRLDRAWWGRGLATEAAALWLSHAIDVLRLPGIIAFAHRNHAASVAVMRKLGLSYLRHDTLAGIDAIVYGSTIVGSRGGPA